MSRDINIVGFWSGLVAFLFTIVYGTVQLLQVSRIVPFPLDEILSYATSKAITITFLLSFLALHYVTPTAKNSGVIPPCFLLPSIAYLLQPITRCNWPRWYLQKKGGTIFCIKIIDQTPHSQLWNFDAIGYIFMGLATWVAVPLFGKREVQRWIYKAFLAQALTTPLISIVYFYPTYSEKLLMLGYLWGITAPLFMLMLSLVFRKSLKQMAVNIISLAYPSPDAHNKAKQILS